MRTSTAFHQIREDTFLLRNWALLKDMTRKFLINNLSSFFRIAEDQKFPWLFHVMKSDAIIFIPKE